MYISQESGNWSKKCSTYSLSPLFVSLSLLLSLLILSLPPLTYCAPHHAPPPSAANTTSSKCPHCLHCAGSGETTPPSAAMARVVDASEVQMVDAQGVSQVVKVGAARKLAV